MRIFFQGTGGFAGRKLEGSLDSATLSFAQARRLKDLLEESGFFDLPPVLRSGIAGADRFSYRVTVETDEGVHTVEAAEEAIPAPMRPFLDFLTHSVRPK